MLVLFSSVFTLNTDRNLGKINFEAVQNEIETALNFKKKRSSYYQLYTKRALQDW